MSFRVLRILLLCLPEISCANLPVAGGLDVPTSIAETLAPVDAEDIARLRMEHGNEIPTAPAAAVYWESGWGVPGFVIIYKDAKGAYQVGVEKRPGDGTQSGLDCVAFESQLAERLVKLIRFELDRVGKGPRDTRLYVDVGIYYFAVSSKPGIAGQTHGVVQETTIGRLCRVVDALSGLPRLKGLDRTQLLGEVDRGVTAIEVAYKQAKLPPP